MMQKTFAVPLFLGGNDQHKEAEVQRFLEIKATSVSFNSIL
jgi:hypothetical protein